METSVIFILVVFVVTAPLILGMVNEKVVHTSLTVFRIAIRETLNNLTQRVSNWSQSIKFIGRRDFYVNKWIAWNGTKNRLQQMASHLWSRLGDNLIPLQMTRFGKHPNKVNKGDFGHGKPRAYLMDLISKLKLNIHQRYNKNAWNRSPTTQIHNSLSSEYVSVIKQTNNVIVNVLHNIAMVLIFYCIVIFLLDPNVSGKHGLGLFQHSFSVKDNYKGKSSLDFLFQFEHLRPPVKSSCYMQPSAMENYFKDVIGHKSTGTDVMRHEWARFASFENFPKTARVSLLRLSQNGFYCIDRGMTAKCFSCGITNDIWPEDESVSEIHRRLSPDCQFVNGKDTSNEAIHGDTHAARSETSEHTEMVIGACGGPSDNLVPYTTQCKDSDINTKSDTTYRHNHYSIQESEIVGNKSSSHNILTETTYKPEYENVTDTQPQYITEIETRPQRRRNETGQTRNSVTYTGIVGRPKYPDYALEDTRRSTYLNWPYSHKVQPNLLVESGLYYTGSQDLVRCYFCGGGMRNWEHGDNPWIEHARWFSTCGYVIQRKGADFINLCRLASNFAGLDTTNSRQVENIETMTGRENEFHIADEPLAVEEQIVESTFDDNLIVKSTSPGAKCILDMGYSSKTVDDAIEELKDQRESTKFSANTIIEFLLDNNYSTGDDLAQGLTITENENTNGASGQGAPENLSTESCEAPVRDESKATNVENSSETKQMSKDEKELLKEENEKLKQIMMCKICMDKDANIVFLPCGHMVACMECAHALKKCAICRKYIKGTIRAFPS